MITPEQKVVQYLNEAHATELTLVQELTAQIAMTPAGELRSGLETHLRQTRDHARRIQSRLTELAASRNPLLAGLGVAEMTIGQVVAMAKAPLNLLRGTGGEEKVLKNIKDACASEALEIATYTALERLAERTGDTTTTELARSIREDEQKMLDRLLGALPALTDAVVDADVRGIHRYDASRTGAAQAARGQSSRPARRRTTSGTASSKRASGGRSRPSGKRRASGGRSRPTDKQRASGGRSSRGAGGGSSPSS